MGVDPSPVSQLAAESRDVLYQVGQRLTVTIHDIAFGGEGVGRVDEFVVFVSFVALHETVEVELTEVKKRFGRARLVRVLEASADRVTPLCPYFADCGGCQYQHLSYKSQLAIKQKQVADLFERIGGFDRAFIQPVVPCPRPYGYRNRIMIRSQWNKPEQKLNIGFIRYDNRLVVDIEECKIAEPAISDQIQNVRRNPPPKGGLKVVLRIPPEGWVVPRDSFFQNNFFLLPDLVKTVRDGIASSGNRFLIDAYCGVGFFGIEAASLVDRVIGVEIDIPAIRSAQENARLRSAPNTEFVVGRAEELLAGLLQKFPAEKTTLLLDPPRTGMDSAAIDKIRAAGPSQILYISCHPATLARDLKLLCADAAYSLQRITPFDMFPQTQHVECVADLRRTGGLCETVPSVNKSSTF